MNRRKLSCPSKNFHAEIELSKSKSISNRLLMIKALSNEQLPLENLSQANDTILLHKILNQTLNTSSEKIEINAQDAGTAYRFLTAYLATKEGEWFLTGSKRMLQRPIGILVSALRSLGADIEYANQEGFPPLRIRGKKLSSTELSIDSHASSQFITAILLISPYLTNGLKINLKQKPSSLPYIDMTIKMMQDFGISIHRDKQTIHIKEGKYSNREYTVEADWSAAAFWYQTVAFSNKGSLLLKNLKLNSIQGDSILPTIFEQLGVKTSIKSNGILIEKTNNIKQNITLDFSQHPDIAMPIINTCAGLGVIGKFSGLESLKIKESNRIEVLESELTKLGFDFRETDENEWILINSCSPSTNEHNFSSISIDTFDDHRVAMSFAPFAILGKSINIKHPEVVIKSYPNFWLEFNKLTIFA
jgi:3-phosphoshikimate 1-carboxyvinyltransferase